MHRLPRHFFHSIPAVWLLCLAAVPQAYAINIPDDPRQSIVYWKPHIISEQNPDVRKVKHIFDVLLRTWDSSRIAPSVHVVKSTTGPWAASLADGNILLSMDAVKTCLSFGTNRSQHLLAFVLAHELAHQRADDLWHQKFFRLIGNQTADKQKKLLRGLDKQWLNDVEQKEAQADHDGLVMMSSVGYDPYQVIDKNDFFTAWVEQLWQGSCARISATHPAKPACRKAQTRRLRAQTQLETTASQTTIYELALQSFVAGDLAGARNLFKVYGRELPSRAVYTGIGLTYLAEALKLKHDPRYLRAGNSLAFYYPIMLDAAPDASNRDTEPDAGAKRGDARQFVAQQYKRIHALITDAIHYLERASKLEPNHKQPYFLLSFAYLLDNNTFMARGILQGKYKPIFGEDESLLLILAMTTAIEGDIPASIRQMERLRATAWNETKSTLPKFLLRYALNFNLAVLYRQRQETDKATHLWQSLAQRAKKRGDTLLFRMALTQLQVKGAPNPRLAQHPQILSYRPGDRFNRDELRQKTKNARQTDSELWIEGEKQILLRLPDSGVRFIVNAGNKILRAWQRESGGATIGRLSIGDSPDRAHKIFGVPDREIFFTRGTYLAYDNFGLGLHIVNDRIAGWFLYDKI